MSDLKECINVNYILNGQLMPCEVFDPCHLTEGLSVYEVIRVIGGKFLFHEDHLERFDSTIKISGLTLTLSHLELTRDLYRLVEANHFIDGNVKLVCNYQGANLSCYMMYYVPHQYPSEKEYSEGVKLVSIRFVRKDPHKKIWRQEFREMVSRVTLTENAWDVLLVNEEGLVCEASKANIFFIRENILYTPPLALVLPGITRKYILTLCEQQFIRIQEENIQYNDLDSFDAVFITGTSPKVLPVSQIDHISFPANHMLTDTLIKEYNLLLDNL
jgi:branched-chain amino acid aminotransferase